MLAATSEASVPGRSGQRGWRGGEVSKVGLERGGHRQNGAFMLSKVGSHSGGLSRGVI